MKANSYPLEGESEMDLETKYRNEIEQWDWESIIKEARNNPQEDFYEGQSKGCAFLGTVFSLTPSGKYYMPWACSNVDEEEASQDEIWNEVLEQVAGEHGGFVESGEGDPCDIFFVLPL